MRIISTLLGLIAAKSTSAATAVTVVGTLALLVSLSALGATSSAESAPFNQNMAQAKEIASQTLAKAQTDGKIYHWAVAMPHDRTPTFCSEHCACLNQLMAPHLKNAGFEVRTILIRPAGPSPLEIFGAPESYLGRASYDYHYITTFRIGGIWYVIDPVILRDAKIEKFALWKKRIETPFKIYLE